MGLGLLRRATGGARRYRRQLGNQATFFGLFEGFVNGTDHVERLLWQVVAFTVRDRLEATDGFRSVARTCQASAGEHFGHVERLRQETLDLTSAGHGHLVFGSQFVHAQDGDDVAQFLVLCQGLLVTAPVPCRSARCPMTCGSI